MAPMLGLPEAAQRDAAIPGVNGFVEPLAVGVVLVIPGSFRWALYDWHGVPVPPKTDGADWEYDGETGGWSCKGACLGLIPKGSQPFGVGCVYLFPGGW
ncbi:hypothetical protein PAXRUDRAFT_153687 [Paxillus rubicundulus Ve08.2h10]|uniref:Uncharacterized protein n=1 Tax=Paxillus rubicundulus Ve08.2h10 TaxID=930991 RepID=A0A0D0CIJ8_9AGAM|nr:hypothetical protein PAXRUDRAFT_153687 [Paxillus rubicundulus Ve08.2h10]